MRGTDRKMGRAATQGRAATALPACGKTGSPYGFAAGRVVLAAMIGAFGMLGVAGVASLVGPGRAEAALPSNLHAPLEVLYGRRAYPLHPDSTVSASYVFNLAGGGAAACTVMTAMDRAELASYSVIYRPDTTSATCDTALRVWATTIRIADDGVQEAVVPYNSLGDTLWHVKKRANGRWGGKQDYFREDGPYLVIHAVNDDADSVLGLVFSRWAPR